MADDDVATTEDDHTVQDRGGGGEDEVKVPNDRPDKEAKKVLNHSKSSINWESVEDDEDYEDNDDDDDIGPEKGRNPHLYRLLTSIHCSSGQSRRLLRKHNPSNFAEEPNDLYLSLSIPWE